MNKTLAGCLIYFILFSITVVSLLNDIKDATESRNRSIEHMIQKQVETEVWKIKQELSNQISVETGADDFEFFNGEDNENN